MAVPNMLYSADPRSKYDVTNFVSPIVLLEWLFVQFGPTESMTPRWCILLSLVFVGTTGEILGHQRQLTAPFMSFRAICKSTVCPELGPTLRNLPLPPRNTPVCMWGRALLVVYLTSTYEYLMGLNPAG